VTDPKQFFWETPRNLAIILGVAIALTSLIFGVVGFEIGRAARAPIVVQVQPAPATH
jgi:hypothetical protein